MLLQTKNALSVQKLRTTSIQKRHHYAVYLNPQILYHIKTAAG